MVGEENFACSSVRGLLVFVFCLGRLTRLTVQQGVQGVTRRSAAFSRLLVLDHPCSSVLATVLVAHRGGGSTISFHIIMLLDI